MSKCKYITLLQRPADMMPEDFHARWKAEGETLHRSVPAELTGYTQNPVLMGGYKKGEPPFDGYAEIWSQGDQNLPLLPLERQCQRTILPVDAHVIRNGSAPENAIKSIELIRQREGMDPTEFRRYWREHHGPLACGIAFLRYEQNHVCRQCAPEAPFDGAAITWFATIDDMRATVGTKAYELTRADEANFLELPLIVLLTGSRVVLSPS